MKSYYEDITPELAKKYLSAHGGNRNINWNAVSDYARDMAAGRWRLTHQSIAFSTDGRLLDGQHRLQAVTRANVTVRMYVTRDADPDSFGVLDTGRPRSVANRFQIEGSKNAVQLAAVARRVTLWKWDKPWSRGITPTREEIAKTIEDHPELTEAATYAHNWPARRTLPPAWAGFCWWLFRSIDTDDGQEFMSFLRTGEGLMAGHPVLVLRDRLLSRHAAGPRSSWLRPESMLALTVLAWNHYRRKNTITKLQLPSVLNDETFPRPV